jgi:ABC-type uncharacterized transport system substrate-binding protein
MSAGAWIRPFIRSLCLMGLLALSDVQHLHRGSRPLVYIGTVSEESDRSYKRFIEAMSARHPEQLRNHPLHYVHVADRDVGLEASTIRAALKLDPQVLITPTANTARAAAGLNLMTPVVFASYQHPVTSGIVDSMSGTRRQHMTGVSLADQWHEKRFELLREAFPSARTLAILADRSWAESDANALEVSAAARRQGFLPILVLAESQQELDAAMTGATATAFDAWYVPATYVAYLHEDRVIAHLDELDAPAIHTTGAEVRSGALLAYAPDTSFVFAAMADLVARVCDGEDAAVIPIEQPWRMVLFVRPRAEVWTRRKLPPTIVRRADEVL